MADSPEVRLQKLQLTLPPAPRPMGVYKPCLLVGNMLYVSGHGPLMNDKTLLVGRIGDGATLEDGRIAARQTGLAILATVREKLGSLDRIVRLVKSLGMVYCTPDFADHPKVINGYSELMAEIFGEDCGVGTRSAVGMGSLPGGITVEIECIFEVQI